MTKPSKAETPPAGSARPGEAERLIARFREDLTYRKAPSWRKLFLNPGRFLANQMRHRIIGRGRPGALRRVRTFHSEGFTVVSGENVSEEIGSYGIYEPTLTEAFLRLVRPGWMVVDIGMHLGYYTTLLAQLVGAEGQVHAFEPTPSTREIAERNVSRFPQVTVHPEAMWSTCGRLQFRDYGIKWMAFNSFTVAKGEEAAGEPTVFEVSTTTLDQFRADLGKPIALVKIDAESAEESILTGAARLLETDRSLISIEVGDATEGASRRVVDRLTAAAYRPWEFRDGRFVPHQPREAYEYDNLIFAPAERGPELD